MDKMQITKLAISAVSSMCVTSVVKNVIQTNTTAPTTLRTKVMMGVGTFIITWMIQTKVETFTNKQIDAVVAEFKKLDTILG